MQTGKLDLSGGRWVAFVATLRMMGTDLTGGDFRMQLRLTRDATGAALVDLLGVASAAEQGVRLIYAGSTTIADHVAAGRLSAIPAGKLGTDTLAISLVGVRINETSMETLPFPGERGDDNPLAWDMHVTPAGGIKQVWLAGAFTIKSGATQ